MGNLKLHSGGQEEYLKILNEKYGKLSASLKNNPKLSSKQKHEELKKLNLELKAERKNSDQNLY